MTDEVSITDRVQVDIEDLSKLDDHVAIPAAEPLEAVFRNTRTGFHRTMTVHGFTADRRALVLAEKFPHLTTVYQAARDNEKFLAIRALDFVSKIRGPFIPAPPGLFAVYDNGTKTPIVYYDFYGRPVVIDADEGSRQLHLALEDEGLVGIQGGPPGDTNASSDND